MRGDESVSPGRHFSSLGQNVANSRPHGIETVRGIHHEMRAFSFFGVRHLPRQNGLKLLLGHIGAGENPLALKFRRRRDHDHRIDALFPAGFEQQGHVNYRNGCAGLFGVIEKLPPRGAQHRVNDFLESSHGGGIVYDAR